MSELAKAYVQIIPTMEGVQGKLGEMLGGEAGTAGEAAGGKFGSAFGTAAKVGLAAVGALAGAITIAGSALVNGSAEVAAYGDNIDKMSQKMGLSISAYQEWDAILQHSGTSIDSMQGAMKTLAVAVENGSEAFTQLGLSQDAIAGMSQEELFGATITALQNVESETERTYLATKLLGRGGVELGALLNTSAEDTEAMRQRVHELGGVMSDEAVKAAAAYQDSLQDMQTAFGGLKNSLLSDFLPGITGVMDGLTSIFSGDSDKGLGQISEGINSVIGAISDNLPKFLELGSTIVMSLLQAITQNLPALISAGADAVLTVANGLLENLPEIIKAGFDVIVSLASGIAENLPELLPTIVETVLTIVEMLIDNVDALIDAAIEIIVALANGLIESLPKLIAKAPEIIAKLVSAIVENAPKLRTAAFELVGKIVEGIVSSLSKLTEKGREIVDKVKAGIMQKVSEAITWGKDLIQNFINGIKAKFSALKDTVSSAAQVVKNFLGFSEPDEGPLSDFHTYAPDMIDLFIQGIESKEKDLREALTTVAKIVDDVFSDIRRSMDLRQDIAGLEYSLWEKEYDANNSALREAEKRLNDAKAAYAQIKEANLDNGVVGEIITNAAKATVDRLQREYDAIKDQTELDKYTKKQEMLNTQLSAQADIVSAAGSAFAEIIKQYGEGSDEALKYYRALLQEQNAYADLAVEMNKVIEARDNLYGVSSPGVVGQIAALGSQPLGASGAVAQTTNSVTVNVTGQAGQSPADIAKAVVNFITQSLRTKEAAWA